MKKMCIVVIVLMTILFSLTLATAYADVEELKVIYTSENDMVFAGNIRRETYNNAETTDLAIGPTFNLPASLQVIEDEAFEGTAIVMLELPENVENIGEKAFANIHSLRMITIPEKTTTIAKDAFIGSNKVTIAAVPGSYARAFARENGLPFTPIAVMTVRAAGVQVISQIQIQRSDIDLDTAGLASEEIESKSWRHFDELQIEQYEQCIAHCIIGRAPPICI